MLKDNLMMLRSINGYSQEEVAGKIGISRQAYAKWESGATVPDIEKCSRLADIYDVTLDSLIKSPSVKDVSAPVMAPKGKNIWGSVTVNDRGQIIIPKEAREKFGIKGGTRLIVLSDETGLALVTAESFEEHIRSILELTSNKC